MDTTAEEYNRELHYQMEEHLQEEARKDYETKY